MTAPTLTLLVVDDSPENRDVLSRRLARKGFQVLQAEGGSQALEIVARQKVDLVLLDIMMPDMDGFEVLRRLRVDHSASQLPVIMQTAKSESEDMVEALELGANDYVTKPLDFPVVLARVQAQLRALRPEKGPAQKPQPVGPGTVLAERYRLEDAIGSGAFGTVYRAVHLELERPVAVKVLRASLAAQGEAVVRFRREGISACRVRHPNAVSVLDFGVDPGGVAYLVMEFLEGHSLLEELEEKGVLSPERAVRIMLPVCDVIAEAHAAGVIHRDIKPSNIFLQRTARGEVPKVLDFGIAKITDESSHQTVTGTVLGTLAFMAPERFTGAAVDPKADVYSLGATLFEVLAGRPPFVAPEDDPMALAVMHATAPPPSLRGFSPGVPEALEAAVMQALRKRPEQRPTALELARNLERSLGIDGKPPPAPSSPSAGPRSQLETATQVAVVGRSVESSDPATQPGPPAEAADGATVAVEPDENGSGK
jgi:DNA-binding response OmpR family regulator